MEALLETRSLLDLPSTLGLSARELLTTTHLSGKIEVLFYWKWIWLYGLHPWSFHRRD